MAIANSRQAISNHLLELQKEIKEEEEEIFADINSLLNDRSNLCSSPDPTETTNYQPLSSSLLSNDDLCNSRLSRSYNANDEDYSYQVSTTTSPKHPVHHHNQHQQHHLASGLKHNNRVHVQNQNHSHNYENQNHNTSSNTHTFTAIYLNDADDFPIQSLPSSGHYPFSSAIYKKNDRNHFITKVDDFGDDHDDGFLTKHIPSPISNRSAIFNVKAAKIEIGSSRSETGNNYLSSFHYRNSSRENRGLDYKPKADQDEDEEENSRYLFNDTTQLVTDVSKDGFNVDQSIDNEDLENRKAELQDERLHNTNNIKKHQHHNQNHLHNQNDIHHLPNNHQNHDNDHSGQPLENEIDSTENLGEQEIQYPDDYGFNNLNNNDDPELQAIIKKVTSNLPKPCVFFLEGNCRRSDCRYSHDLSKIICKYWIEGFCFKGEMCPFVHSYHIPDSDLSDDEQLDDPLSSKKHQQLNPTFVIESEVDFPSLAGE